MKRETTVMSRGNKLVAFFAVLTSASMVVIGASAADTAPLPLKLPAPTMKGTPPDNPPKGPNIEPLVLDKERPPFMALAGVVNVASNKTVTCSDPKPSQGELSLITDGSKEPVDEDVLELHKGVQYVQVDLGGEYAISAIAVWYDHRYYQIIHDVVVQVSSDAAFKTNVRTLYNNDVDNSAGLGVGKDKEYFETKEGRVIDGQNVKARYVRCYSQGNTQSPNLNSFTEIEVYALPEQKK